MKKSSPIIVFVILLFLIFAAVYSGKKLSFQAKDAKMVPSATPSSALSEPQLPISVDSQSVTGAYARYVVTGKIKEIKNSDIGPEIVLETADPKVPKITTGQWTRFHKASPPYALESMKTIKIGDLRPGNIVDISMEYDLRNKVWTVWDVYLPTDRNP